MTVEWRVKVRLKCLGCRKNEKNERHAGGGSFFFVILAQRSAQNFHFCDTLSILSPFFTCATLACSRHGDRIQINSGVQVFIKACLTCRKKRI